LFTDDRIKKIKEDMEYKIQDIQFLINVPGGDIVIHKFKD
jgi:hypothetical protein